MLKKSLFLAKGKRFPFSTGSSYLFLFTINGSLKNGFYCAKSNPVGFQEFFFTLHSQREIESRAIILIFMSCFDFRNKERKFQIHLGGSRCWSFPKTSNFLSDC